MIVGDRVIFVRVADAGQEGVPQDGVGIVESIDEVPGSATRIAVTFPGRHPVASYDLGAFVFVDNVE